MGTVPQNVPIFNSYLNAPDNIYQSKTEGGGLKVGICWIGRPRHLYDPYRNRSCPVNSFGLIAQLSGVEIYNLQVDATLQSDAAVFIIFYKPAEADPGARDDLHVASI